MKILVTGVAGFIGLKLAYELAKRGGDKPHVSLHDRIAEFMKWYKSEKNPL